MDIGAPEPHTGGAGAQLGGCPEQRLARGWAYGAGIGRRRIEKRSIVGAFQERPRDVPAKSNVDSKLRGKFHVILNVRGKVDVSQSIFGDKPAEGGVHITQKIAGEGGPRVPLDVFWISGVVFFKKNSPATALAFVVVLI